MVLKYISVYLLGFLILVLPETTIAQIFDTKGAVAPAETTSPFMNNIHNGVSYQTGSSNFSLRLFSLKVDDEFEIPVDISYTAKGIKYGQSSGEIGVGWDFSANYRITRTMYCRPDEYFPKASEQEINNLVSSSNKIKRDQDMTQFTNGLPTNGGLRLRSGLSEKDSEYDIFDYNTPFHAGSFVIQDVTAKKIVSSENRLIKFDYDISTDGIRSFTAQDTKGNKIVAGFDEKQRNYLSEYTYAYPGKKNSFAWPVTRITTANNRNVDFTYNLKDISEGLYPGERGFSITEATSMSRADAESTTFSDDINDGSSGSRRTYLAESITSPYGMIKIFRGTYSELIDSIVLYDQNENRIKSARFNRSYTLEYKFLDKVTISGRDLLGGEEYNFGYAKRDISRVVPDIWNNLMFPRSDQSPSTELSYPNPLGDVTFWDPQLNQTIEQKVTSRFPSAFANRSPYPSSDIFSLQKVIFPTGGSISYEYEPNYFLNFYGIIKQGPGIRIVSVSKFDPVSEKIEKISYTYGQNQNGAGTIPVEIDVKHYGLDQVRLYPDVGSPSQFLILHPGRIRSFSNSVILTNV